MHSAQVDVRPRVVTPTVGPLRVLYVSHTGLVGGAEWSLLELLRGIGDAVEPCLACPEGELAALARDAGVPIVAIAPVRLSFRLTPWHTLAGLAGSMRTAYEIRRAARRFDADLVHANSVRAGLAAIVARGMGAPPVVVHVRDALPSGSAGRLVSVLMSRGAAAVLANSRFTASTLGPLAGGRAAVVHNPVDLDRFAPSVDARSRVRGELGIPSEAPVLGVVAQLTPWKAQDDAIRILARVRETYADTQLLLAGEPKFTDSHTRHDNLAFANDLRRIAQELAVAEAVRFLGERRDVPEVLAALDILLVPSWEEPFGRSMLEAMAAGVPVVATAIGGPREVIVDSESGILLPPRDPGRWAAEVVELLADPARRGRMRDSARQVVSRFGPGEHAAAILARYRASLEFAGGVA